MWPWSSEEKKKRERREKTREQPSCDPRRLRRAAQIGDAAAVRKLLATRNVDVDARDVDDWTALHVAADSGHARVVEVLLEAGASVDATDSRSHIHGGTTALHRAVMEGHTQVVKLLLEAGASVDGADKDGRTALHRAVSYGLAEIVDLLLEFKASVDATDKDGRTALHHAASNGKAHVVVLLLKSNASADMTDKYGDTALHHAVRNGYTQVVNLLLTASASIDGANKLGKTALHEACLWHRPDTVRVLLMSNAKLNVKDQDGLQPLHQILKAHTDSYKSVDAKSLETVQVLVTYGAVWDTKCDEMVVAGVAWEDAPALALCMARWVQEFADGVELSEVPIEVVKRGATGTRAYLDDLKSSAHIVLRRKICLVGPSSAGKTSFVKSITTKKPQLEHVDNRTIGIDHFPLSFEQTEAHTTSVHEVTFWDFAGQDAYQVAHSLFFSPRTLFLVCVDIEAFTLAYLQASIMSDLKKQETQLMDEFVDRTVMQWVRIIVGRQPDAEFVFVATKEDLLQENPVTERLLKNLLMAKLYGVNMSTQELRREPKGTKDSKSSSPPNVTFVSCTSLVSVHTARTVLEEMITQSNRSFKMPDTYTQALQAIIAMRAKAKSLDITSRINRVFTPADSLPVKLGLKPEQCRVILQALHDLGDVLWYEDLGVELFQDHVILDPLLLIDFIRQVINHKSTDQTMPHAELKALPYWNGLSDKDQMKALKQVLQEFHLVYSADSDRVMRWNSDLVVPAYWQTKTPASWLFLGDILRITDTYSCDGEAARTHWEFHFEFGLPLALFDHLVVASVSPYFRFDAGPDWIVYEEKEIAACRIMVGRDPKSLHRTIHVEAVVAESAGSKQVEKLWASFGHCVSVLFTVLFEFPGLVWSSFAWDDAERKIGLDRLMGSGATASPRMSDTWMPPEDTWKQIQGVVQSHMN